MIEGLKRYDAYRISEIPWLGEIPSHWATPLNQRVFKEKIRPYKDGTVETPLSLSQRAGLIPTSDMEERSLETSSYDNWKITLPGDLVLNRFKAHLGVFFASTMRGIVSFHYGVFRPRKEILSKYYELLYHSPAYRTIYAGRSNGMTVGLQNLSNQNFYNVRTLLPPLDEQAAIVKFIDYADRRIRRYIRAKQKLIKLLEEQKQAIIHQAVTRGLDPNVRLKPSGVEWLGDVPEHWCVTRLGKLLCGLDQGWSPRAAEGDLEEDQWAVLSLSAIRKGNFVSEALKPISLETDVPDGIEINDGDVLVTRSNTRKLVGDAAIVINSRPRTIFSDLIYRLRPASSVNPRHLLYLLLSPLGRLQMEREARGSSGTMPKLAQRHIRGLIVVVPTAEEQDEIVEWLRMRTSVLAAAIKQTGEEIALLHEFRTGLIADVVTGKLDVREAAANLPDELDSEDPGVEESDEIEASEDLFDEEADE